MNFNIFKDTSDIIDSLGNAVDKTFTSDEERLTWQSKLAEQKLRFHEMQHELNLKEVSSPRLFNSGWRPSIGWVCGISLSLYFIPKFAIGAYIFIAHYISTGAITQYPVDGAELFTLVTSLLGMGVLRTYKKQKGLTK